MYSGNGMLCLDINECIENVCHTNALCFNIAGHLSVFVKLGDIGNGSHCSDINECHTNPCSEFASCSNTDGKFVCTCHLVILVMGFLVKISMNTIIIFAMEMRHVQIW